MSHFAELDENNIVLRVVVGDNAMSDADALAWCEQNLGGRWVQTSYNGRIRKNFAGTGFTYDQQRDAFIAPQPFASWTLDDETCRWVPPVPMPQDGAEYLWDEQTLAWVPL